MREIILAVIPFWRGQKRNTNYRPPSSDSPHKRKVKASKSNHECIGKFVGNFGERPALPHGGHRRKLARHNVLGDSPRAMVLVAIVLVLALIKNGGEAVTVEEDRKRKAEGIK
jgi:hypothetical protein